MRRPYARVLAVALLGMLGAGCATPPPPAWTVPSDLKIAHVNGYPLAYSEAGSGVPVVYLHGAWVDYRLYRPASATLATRYRVILPSLRHYYPEIWNGKSEPISVRQQAADVAGLIRALGAGKVHLVAHSMAGSVGVEVARTSPELLRSLVLADPAGPVSVLPDPDAARRRLDGMSKLAQGIRAQLEAGGDRAKAAAFGWNAAIGPGAFERMPDPIRQMMADNIGTMAAVPDTDPPALECGAGRSFGIPVLIMHGQNSPKFYLDIEAGLRRCRSGIESTVVVPGAGHNMQVENAAFFNEALMKFFAGK